MSKQVKHYFFVILFFIIGLISPDTCSGDTFTHKTNGQIYHGYAHHDVVDGKTPVMTVESGLININLAEYTIIPDNQGRIQTVSVFAFGEEPLADEIVTEALKKSIIEESNKGPLAIVLEINCPGGRMDLMMDICAFLLKMTNCKTIAYINEKGAFSAAAIVSLACDKIYMNPGTVIGAATLIVSGPGIRADLEKVYGEQIAEKDRSAARNFMAAIAEAKKRPAALVRAMETKDIEIIQVRRGNRTLYIEKTEKLPTDELLRIKKPQGQILTLPAGEAVECGIADKVVDNLQDILADQHVSDAKVEYLNYMDSIKDTLIKNKEEQDKIIRKFNQLKNSFDVKVKTLMAKSRNGGITVTEAKKSFKGIIQEIKYLIKLKQTYPNVPCEEEELQDLLNSLQAEYDSL